jgi:putative membrane protein
MNPTLPTNAQILASWNFSPSIWLGFMLLVGVYALSTGPLRQRYGWGKPVSNSQQTAFYLGTVAAWLALVSPLDYLGDNYLLSAHMIQHMLLILVAPPLWLAGLPDWLVDRALSARFLGSVVNKVTRPVPAFLIFNGLFLVWHLPSLYDSALASEEIHIIEHLCFLGSAIIGWWPVVGPSRRFARPASQPFQMLYLFFNMFPTTALGAIITFSAYPPYPFYETVQRLWGFTVQADQQLAGLIMWIPGTMVFFAFFSLVFMHWINAQSSEEEEGLMNHEH